MDTPISSAVGKKMRKREGMEISYFFWWSGKNGQFDDLEGPAHRILMDDDSTDKLLENEIEKEEQESEK